jgi:protein-S-isoprenylcysteine O-methyltransferase Ste14
MTTFITSAFARQEVPRADRTTPAGRLPSLGRRGGGWVGLQLVFLCAAVATGLLGTPWPAAARPWLAVPGGTAVLAGLGLLLGGCVGLGRQLTPFPKPISGGELRRDGAYRLVRHPMYGGALVVLLGWTLLSSPLALLPLSLAGVFLEAKSRREEAWLAQLHPDYASYRLQVQQRFLPWLW